MDRACRKILVTGAAGYIGSLLVTQLLEGGYQVRGFDNLTYGGHGLLPFFSDSRFEFIYGDLRDEKDLDRALADMDGVVHLAAIVGDPACRQNPQEALEVNKTATRLLCDKSIEREIRRFVFASTCSNYGKMSDPAGMVDESSGLKPVSLYAELKIEFERYLMDVRVADFVPVVLRFATAYGLSGRPRFDLTVNEFAKELALGRRLEVYGEQFWRPYAHVRDLGNACVLALEAQPSQVAYEAFNVGDSSENYQKKTVVQMILAQLPEMGARVSFVRRHEDPRDYRVSFAKVSSTLGFRGSRNVSDGIREVIFAVRSGIIKNPDDPLYRDS